MHVIEGSSFIRHNVQNKGSLAYTATRQSCQNYTGTFSTKNEKITKQKTDYKSELWYKALCVAAPLNLTPAENRERTQTKASLWKTILYYQKTIALQCTEAAKKKLKRVSSATMTTRMSTNHRHGTSVHRKRQLLVHTLCILQSFLSYDGVDTEECAWFPMISSPRTIPNHTFLSNDCSYDVNKALYLFRRHRLCERGTHKSSAIETESNMCKAPLSVSTT